VLLLSLSTPTFFREVTARNNKVKTELKVSSANNPLIDPAPAEIPLKDAPLVRVVSQVRFPTIASIAKRDFIAPFQEALRAKYPILREENILEVTFASDEPVKKEPVWRFFDAEEDWRVSLTSGFLAFETRKYESRKDFLKKLRFVLDALEECFSPGLVDRVGLRYVDQVTGEGFPKLPSFIRQEMLGVLAHSLGESTFHSLSESVFDVPEQNARLLTRWGKIPEGGTIDPGVMEPIDTPSWILDLDMFSRQRREYKAEEISELISEFADRIYSFFRWVVTDEFLKYYGGQ
tara:strand:+ start:830 stop:1702 length:873 start_codon:yes stop_codon:yes gene_type:complete